MFRFDRFRDVCDDCTIELVASRQCLSPLDVVMN